VGKIGAPLICGKGETEQEILEMVRKIRGMAAIIIMFALFPERGSLMED
jgi:biotin synthase-related radical SAM superfamily protein